MNELLVKQLPYILGAYGFTVLILGVTLVVTIYARLKVLHDLKVVEALKNKEKNR